MAEDIESRVRDELNKSRLMSWTDEIRGFSPKSNKQMLLYVRDFPRKVEVFKDIISFFNGFSDLVSEERLVKIIRSVQEEILGHGNFNMPKLSGVKQYMKMYEKRARA